MLERTVNALYLFSIIYEAYIPYNEKLFDLWSFLTVRNYKWPQKSTVITMLFSFILTKRHTKVVDGYKKGRSCSKLFVTI